MLYSTMHQEFILLLLAYGLLSSAAILLAVRFFAHSSGRLFPVLSGLMLCSLSMLFAIRFMMVVTPTASIMLLLKNSAYAIWFLFLLLLLLSVIFFLLRKSLGQKDFIYGSILNDIDDYVFVFDRNGCLLAQNRPRQEKALFPNEITSIENIATQIQDQKTDIDILHLPEKEVIIAQRHYLFTSSSILSKKGSTDGQIVLFHEITEQSALIEELRRKNEEADELNASLHQEMEIRDELLLFQEYQRFAASIHITLESRMKDISDDIIRMKTVFLPTKEERERNLRSITEELREMLADIRKIVYQK